MIFFTGTEGIEQGLFARKAVSMLCRKTKVFLAATDEQKLACSKNSDLQMPRHIG
jgi:hypothetical protein